MGILVWQEFPLACAFLTRLPDSSSYLRLLENETRAIVRDLRSHPSLVLWCGGNEFDPGRNRPAIAVMRRVVGEEDPERTFRPASPSGGDGHNWNVWHGFQPPSSYAHDPSLFASEFGLQSPPSVSALEQFIPAKDLWPPGPAWPFHGAELEKLWRYARPYLNAPDPSLAEVVGACQLAQARGLQIAIEHFRRGKARGGGGVLVWQLNEPWPAISWALVDDAREPKAAYEMVKQLMAPLLISLEYPLVHYRAGDTLCGKVWVINDRDLRYENCQVEVNLWSREGQAVERLRQRVDVAADTAQITGELAWRLPPGGNWRITCFLLQDKEVLAANDYDLGRHDSGSPTARRKLRTWLRNLVVPPLRD
jgi:beta-mannosidase